ncbi:MAG TPA: HAD family hydrolase [Deltaproteobacteria bacterium]|nr:HAD family hydrolase [Deltaproteobacteria bacterium]HOM28400.1 HAD family hydrolase [Deltaproteobacteria bacterium]
MSSSCDAVRTSRNAPASPVAALFDMDHTLTWKNAGLTSIQFAYRQGLAPRGLVVLGALRILLYRLSLVNIEQWYERNVSLLRGAALEDMERFAAGWFSAMIKPALYRDAVRLVEEHRRSGHRLVLVSNSPPFLVRVVADGLSIGEIITTILETEDGRLTGRIVKPLCYGTGKRLYVLKWASENGVDLSKSSFYTDSFYDIHLLFDVGRPVAVNPDRRLRAAARRFGWEIMDFERVGAFGPKTPR